MSDLAAAAAEIQIKSRHIMGTRQQPTESAGKVLYGERLDFRRGDDDVSRELDDFRVGESGGGRSSPLW